MLSSWTTLICLPLERITLLGSALFMSYNQVGTNQQNCKLFFENNNGTFFHLSWPSWWWDGQIGDNFFLTIGSGLLNFFHVVKSPRWFGLDPVFWSRLSMHIWFLFPCARVLECLTIHQLGQIYFQKFPIEIYWNITRASRVIDTSHGKILGFWL